jgi:NAD(P)H dehydrogenase (quinone)
MNVLIVHAHPEPKSFTTAMKDAAVAELTAQGRSVEVSDLYAMGFDPIAKADDFSARRNSEYLVYALEQRHAHETESLAADIRAELDKLMRADLIILSFPMFWFSVPAILKGWIDRVLISGLCYGGKRFYDRGGLRGKRMLAAFTLGGSEHMFGPDAVHGEIEIMLRPIAWHVPYVSADARSRYLTAYREHLRRLEDMQPLRFPSLESFDERLNPIQRGV